MKTLKIADGLSLPLSFATKTAAILAQRRKGKTYTAAVIAEEMVAAKQPFVALDPTGAWWGLRASADGKDEGLPVVILGGQHGDVALERTAGRVIADLVVDEPGYYVIDFSLFESGEAERQFAVDFAERLYRAKGQPGKDFPLHLFVDEADRFVPQHLRKGSGETSPRLLGAFEAIVRRGGLRGLGTTLISQRAAVVNKNVLEMLDILFVLRTLGPNDRAAIDGYVKAHGTTEELKALQASVASLEIGEAWVWEPGAEPPLFQRVNIRKRTTFNSSATPEHGKTRVEPRRLAAVDLAALGQRMADTIQKAKQDDPRELRKVIAEKDKRINELERHNSADVGIKQAPERINVLTDADRDLIERLDARFLEIVDQLSHKRVAVVEAAKVSIEATVREAHEQLCRVHDDAVSAFLKAIDGKRISRIREKTGGLVSRQAENWSTPREHPRERPGQSRPLPAAQPGRASVATRPADGSLGRCERAILTVLANQPNGCEVGRLTLLTGYRYSGGFRNSLGALRSLGYISGDNTGILAITESGKAAIGPVDPLPSGADLGRYWQNHPSFGKCERAVLTELLKHPSGLTADELCQLTHYEYSGGFRNSLGALRTAGVLVGQNTGTMRASEELFS